MRRATALLLIASLGLNGYLGYRVWSGSTSTQISRSSQDVVVMRTSGGLLEVSTVSAEKRFDSTTRHTVLGVSVGSTVAQVRVAAVYRYHIPLALNWDFRVNGKSLVVIAPSVRPSLPVAIDTGKLESFASGIWSPLTGTDAVRSLRRSITAKLDAKAATPDLIQLQREAARRTVGEFVEKWVVDQPRWKSVKPPTVLVFFQDEPLGRKAIPLRSVEP